MQGQVRRWFSALLAILLVGFGATVPEYCYFASAQAEQAVPELEISVTADPHNPAAGDEVALSFLLNNHSEETIVHILLATPEGYQSELEETAEPGEALSFTQIHPVTQNEVEAGAISYLVTCETASGRYSYPAIAVLNQLIARPDVEFLRHVSGRTVSGGSLTVVYELHNAGNVSAQNLTVTDSLGSFSASLERLEVGETKSFVQHTVITEPTVSSPVLTYSIATAPEDVCSIRLDEMTVSVADEAVNLILTSGRSMFAENTADVVLRLTNVGDTAYPSLTVYDALYGGIIADSIALPAGQAVEVSYSYPIRDNEQYCWRVTGTSAAGGHLDQLTNTVTVPKNTGESSAQLMLSASAKYPKISRSGYVPFTLTLTNLGSANAARVRIYEETLGELGELAVVPTGDPMVLTERVLVENDIVYHFSAVFTNTDGRTHTIYAEPVEVLIAAGGERPESENNPQEPLLFSGSSMHVGNSSIFLWLLAGSCTVLIALSIILFVTSRKARKERRERAAARKQRVKEELGKTNRFKPVKRQNPKKQVK